MSENKELQINERIHAQRTSYSPNHERIADYLLTHTLDAALLTATELAQRLDMDPATVVRFAQKLGYRGYLELKTDLGRLVRGESRGTDPPPMSSLSQALEEAKKSLSSEFDALWDSIDRSELIQVVELLGIPYHLLLLSDGASESTARWLAIELREKGFRIDHPIEDPSALGESMLSLGDYDRALILEGMTPSPALEHIAQELQRKKTRSLAILGSSASQVAHYVDTVLFLQSIRDPAFYPSILRQLLTTILHAVRQLHEAYQNNDEFKGGPQGDIPQGENAL